MKRFALCTVVGLALASFVWSGTTTAAAPQNPCPGQYEPVDASAQPSVDANHNGTICQALKKDPNQPFWKDDNFHVKKKKKK
jgi:hypothetical protein